jgi:uncharacterized protein YggE
MEVKMLKKSVLVAVAIALLVPVALAGVWLWGQVTSPVVAQTSDATTVHDPTRTITVVGQGKVSVEPDIAQVSVGVETSAETVGEAVQANQTQMEAILAALEGLGLAEKDIQTMNYSIQLDRYPEPMPRVEGSAEDAKPLYRVSNMVMVTIRDLDRVGDVLDSVIEAGANNIWGVSFGLDDPEAARADARANAVADALARAEALAELSGVEVGPVMAVSEVVGGGVSPMPAAMVERAASGAGPISPGELEVGYQVQVTYFIAP